jgi:hypothetical protein
MPEALQEGPLLRPEPAVTTPRLRVVPEEADETQLA